MKGVRLKLTEQRHQLHQALGSWTQKGLWSLGEEFTVLLMIGSILTQGSGAPIPLAFVSVLSLTDSSGHPHTVVRRGHHRSPRQTTHSLICPSVIAYFFFHPINPGCSVTHQIPALPLQNSKQTDLKHTRFFKGLVSKQAEGGRVVNKYILKNQLE